MKKGKTAQLKYLDVAPRKVRLVANTLRGMSVNEAQARLMLRPQRSTQGLLKLLRSAIANVKDKGQMDISSLVISEIYVDEGPILKRIMPRAQGRATPIHKVLSHVSITLTPGSVVSNRFEIIPKKKDKKVAKQSKKTIKQVSKEDVGKEKAKPQKSSAITKLFNRKSIEK
ncbi:MAG: 50S ribosomal protein L22 [Candidatus Harrisonbacteria bacterium CG10_big_fil_rev_8_21_14_0_10_38_8]|uniref:Large ribosomal subunit protein uL22 n=1 Tax=Candidatus Harrisonbacteria bacterium CG10_big_fil_rev_8_21_14_0_10_38_8 TaxID=1974582 RepID=A0A2M6WK80_9BACT|nr:MAG: 50S ribosomal protein L22 [Candidatus Harrisonbacteria bacterium CG10_big_fil_rev_8_21_14_0_10_38_8]